jgi:Lysylphosphatidylglycerol synthase TM region
MLRILIHPAVLLPVLLAGALLAVAFKLGDLPQVIERVRAIPVRAMLVALVMAAFYLAIKILQLRLLLSGLGLRFDWRRLALAFAVGELALTLPFGVFAQNWVLTRSGVARFSRSSAATVVMLLVETFTVLLLLAIAGIPRWPQTRPVAAAFLVGILLLAFAVLRFQHLARRRARRIRQPALRRLFMELFELIRGVRRLLRPRMLAVAAALAVAYLGALAFAFLAVGRGVGVHSLDFLSAASIYAFSLAGVLLCGGMVTQIGTVEVLGMGAAQAWGLGLTDGLALMLGFRLVWTGAMWLLNLPAVLLLWRTLRRRPVSPASELSADQFEKSPD